MFDEKFDWQGIYEIRSRSSPWDSEGYYGKVIYVAFILNLRFHDNNTIYDIYIIKKKNSMNKNKTNKKND